MLKNARKRLEFQTISKIQYVIQKVSIMDIKSHLNNAQIFDENVTLKKPRN